jgi:sigma-B regulation protein RsbU (phosphoserine phosphatase)
LIATLNRLLYRRLRRESFFTIFFGVLDPVSGELTFCNGGQTPPLVYRNDGTLERLDSTGPIAGIFAEAAYKSVTIKLAVGDRLVVFSDGVTESENATDEEFGEQRLRKALLGGNARTAEEICDAIVETLTAFRGSRPYNDDVTMLVVARTAAEEQSEADHGVITYAAV